MSSLLKINNQIISFGYGPLNGLGPREKETQKWIFTKNIQGYIPFFGNISGFFRAYHFSKLNVQKNPSLEAVRIVQIRRGYAEMAFCGLGLAVIDLAAAIHGYAKRFFCSFFPQKKPEKSPFGTQPDHSRPTKNPEKAQVASPSSHPSASPRPDRVESGRGHENPHVDKDIQAPPPSSPFVPTPSPKSPGASPESQNALFKVLAQRYASLGDPEWEAASEDHRESEDWAKIYGLLSRS